MSGKMPLSWYKDGLKNASDYEERLREELARYQVTKTREILKCADDNDFRRFQIKMAEKKGLDSFSDHFQKKAWEKKQKEKS